MAIRWQFRHVVVMGLLLAGTLPSQAPLARPAKPMEYGYRVVKTFPHDPHSFTQGFEFHDGLLFEGTGMNGQSYLKKEKLETGQVLQQSKIDDQFFGEGITVVGQQVYQITWKSGTGFVYDKTSFVAKRAFQYPGEGWGLATDGSKIYMSDGTDTIRVWDPATLKELRRFRVRDGATPVDQLNELEYINGEIYANIWQTERIVRLSPVDGRVLGYIDLTGLRAAAQKVAKASEPMDVLNGIAWDAAGKRLLVTGKYWPRIYQIELVKK